MHTSKGKRNRLHAYKIWALNFKLKESNFTQSSVIIIRALLQVSTLYCSWFSLLYAYHFNRVN